MAEPILDISYFEGQLLPTADLHLPAGTLTTQLGLGVFDTIAVIDGQARQLELHTRRLGASAQALGLSASAEIAAKESQQIAAELLTALRSHVGASRKQRYRLRLQVMSTATSLYAGRTPGDTPDIWGRLYADPAPAETPWLWVSPFRRDPASPLGGHKTTSQMGNLRALELARQRGYQEAIWLGPDGEIAEATFSNLLWFRDREVYAPPPESGAFGGITAHTLLEACRSAGIKTHVERLYPDDISSQDGFLLTSVARDVQGVGGIERWKCPGDEEFLRKLQAIWAAQLQC